MKNRMANSVESDERAYYEPSHLGLHCLQKYMSWSTELKVFRVLDTLGRFSTIFCKKKEGTHILRRYCSFPA